MTAATVDWAAYAAQQQAQALQGMKLSLTRAVEALDDSEGADLARRAQLVHGALEAAQDWQDAWPFDSSSFGGALAIRLAGGWDSRPGLRRRVLEHRRTALIETRAPGAAPESVTAARASGFVEGAAEGAENLRKTADKALDALKAGADSAGKAFENLDKLALVLLALGGLWLLSHAGRFLR